MLNVLHKHYSKYKGIQHSYSATSHILQLQRCCSCHRQSGCTAYRP